MQDEKKGNVQTAEKKEDKDLKETEAKKDQNQASKPEESKEKKSSGGCCGGH